MFRKGIDEKHCVKQRPGSCGPARNRAPGLIKHFTQHFTSLMLNRGTRLIKLGSRTLRKGDGHTFGGIRPVGTMTAINASIRFKGVGDTAMVIHHQFGVLPMTTELKTGSAIINEATVSKWPVI